MTVRVGVIGYGYWGPNLVRNLADVPDAAVVAVSDLQEDRLDRVRVRYPGIRTTPDAMDLIADPTIDALVVATPVSSHYSLAMAALRANKHVLVEKPMAMTSDQARELIEEAEHRNRVLMVDHTFVYTGAVRKIKELVDGDQLGRLYYYDSVRINLGLFQHDVNVLWDLAVHDLTIMDYILGAMPQAVSAIGTAHVPGQPEDVAYMTCFFDDDLIAHFHVSWLAPVKMRRTLLGGDRQMIVYDDLEPSEKVKIYDKGITVGDATEGDYQLRVGYRAGDMWAPQVALTEALKTEMLHFVDCIQRGARPLTDGQAGLRVVQLLEAATSSMHRMGQRMDVRSESAGA